MSKELKGKHAELRKRKESGCDAFTQSAPPQTYSKYAVWDILQTVTMLAFPRLLKKTSVQTYSLVHADVVL